LFAVEIILGDFGVAQFSPIVISAVSATVVSHRFLGDFPAFEVPAYSLMHASELFAYAALGILAAVVAIAFIRTLYGLEDLFAKSRLDPRLQPVLGGTLIGLIGVFLPHIFGVGYEAINEALNGTLVWQLMALLVIVKIVAVSITIGSGGSGGIFAPSLFIGAMLGGAVGTGVQSFWPTIAAGPGAYALVGMGAVVAAATHAPITAILIIFELTGSYPIILPLMISCIIATLISIRLRKESIYTLKLLRRGVDIYRGRAINVLQHVPVREVIRTDVATITPDEGVMNLVSRFVDHPGDTLFVTDETRELLGIITADQIRPVMRDPSTLAGLIIAEDVMVAGEYPRVTAGQSLAEVMKFLGGYRGEIPVLENGRLAGVIWAQDVIERYNSEIFKRDMAGSMARAVNPESTIEPVSATCDAVVAEVPVPRRFVGRTIRDLNIRQSFGVTVLVIKRTHGDGGERVTTTPDADYAFEAGDVMLVLGSTAQLPYVRTGVPKEG
jgi:CIC family chloride channel protein